MGTCVICSNEGKGREVYPHGFMCRSCASCFFAWKRGGKWLRKYVSK